MSAGLIAHACNADPDKPKSAKAERSWVHALLGPDAVARSEQPTPAKKLALRRGIRLPSVTRDALVLVARSAPRAPELEPEPPPAPAPKPATPRRALVAHKPAPPPPPPPEPKAEPAPEPEAIAASYSVPEEPARRRPPQLLEETLPAAIERPAEEPVVAKAKAPEPPAEPEPAAVAAPVATPAPAPTPAAEPPPPPKAVTARAPTPAPTPAAMPPPPPKAVAARAPAPTPAAGPPPPPKAVAARAPAPTPPPEPPPLPAPEPPAAAPVPEPVMAKAPPPPPQAAAAPAPAPRVARAPKAPRAKRIDRPRRPTPMSPNDATRYLAQAWEHLTGERATEAVISVLWGQWALETGRGRWMVDYNYAGLKGRAPDGGTANWWTWEEADDGARRIRARFRSYEAPEHGALDYVEMLLRRYPKAVAAARRGDAVNFILELDHGGFFTERPEHYVRSVASLAREFRRDNYAVLFSE